LFGDTQMHHHGQIRRRLVGHDAQSLNHVRQFRQRLRDAVLNLDLGLVDVSPSANVMVNVITPSAVACVD